MESTFIFVSFVLESSQNLKLLYQLSFNLSPNLAKVAYYFPVAKRDWVSNSPDGHITWMQHVMDACTSLPCVVRQFATKICEENGKVTSQTQYLLCEEGLGILRCSSAYHGATSWQTHWEWKNTINPVNAQNLGPSGLAGVAWTMTVPVISLIIIGLTITEGSVLMSCTGLQGTIWIQENTVPLP